MSDAMRTPLLFTMVAVLIIGTGIFQDWNVALLLLNYGLISAIMARRRSMEERSFSAVFI